MIKETKIIVLSQFTETLDTMIDIIYDGLVHGYEFYVEDGLLYIIEP